MDRSTIGPRKTEDYILGATAAGKDPNTLISSTGQSVYDWLTANIGSATTGANRTGKLAQALVAGRRSPTNFAGQNILGLLEGPGATTAGFYNARTGSFDTGRDAAFAQSNAMLGLVAANNPTYPVAPAATQYLKNLQDLGSGIGFGGWKADGRHEYEFHRHGHHGFLHDEVDGRLLGFSGTLGSTVSC